MSEEISLQKPTTENEKTVSYTLVCGKCKTDGAVGETVYGIKGTMCRNSKVTAYSVIDISANKAKVMRLLDKLNRLQPVPKFLDDIVEDFLVEEYSL